MGNLIKDRLTRTAKANELIEFDVCLVVADYLDDVDGDNDRDDAFDDAQADVDGAIAMAKAELKDILDRDVEVTECVFDEFDSGNVNHACAHFTCKFIGTKADELKIDKYFS